MHISKTGDSDNVSFIVSEALQKICEEGELKGERTDFNKLRQLAPSPIEINKHCAERTQQKLFIDQFYKNLATTDPEITAVYLRA